MKITGFTWGGLVVALLLFMPQMAWAQGAVQQSGPVTPGHIATWARNGAIMDGGAPGGVGAPGNPTWSIQYNNFTGFGGILCLSGQFVISTGAASPPVCATPGLPGFRFAASGSTGNTDNATSADGPLGTIAWNSSSTSNKTQLLFACASLYKGYRITIADEIGTASTYPISIIPGAGTINGLSSYPIYISRQSYTLNCDGVSNWVIL